MNDCYFLSLKELISQRLDINQQDIFLFWKGRIALYAILKAIGIKERKKGELGSGLDF